MVEYTSNKAISLINQRRKSSPECLFSFNKTASMPPTPSTNSLIQKQQKKDQAVNNWIQSGKQSFKEVFHVNSSSNVKNLSLPNNKTVVIDNTSFLPPSPPHTPFLVENSSDNNSTITTSTNNTRFLRSHSQTSRLSSSSYNSTIITLPAAPVIIGSGSSSIKKKRRSLLRASITGSSSSSDFLFKQNPSLLSAPSQQQDRKMMTMTAAMDSPVHSHRNSFSSDIELATEIGQGLLSEVRRMQSILQERQDALMSLELEKTEHQQRISELLKQLRYKNEVEERLNEDIWNLELTKQDLSHQIRQLSQSIARSQLEGVKRERQSTLVQQELELIKASQLNWQELMNKAQQEYESSLSNLTNQLVKLKREKDTITSQLEHLSKAQKVAKEEEAQEENRQKKMFEQEIKSLQISLMQAHTVVENLQSDLQTEKQKKCEVDALLRESQETIESMQQRSSTTATSIKSWCLDSVASSLRNESAAASSLEQEIESAESRITAEKYDGGSLKTMKDSSVVNTSDITTLEGECHNLPPSNNNEFQKVLPCVMHTMIGEWLFKYTRNKVGHGISNNSHQRFFWLHPYTKTLYWSENAPGTKKGEFKAKSVSIESFYIDKVNNNKPIIVIQSITRKIQMQCINKDSHGKWVQSLNDLLKDEEVEVTAPLDSPPPCPQPRQNKNTGARNKRFSLLLERNPPSTIRQQKWRLSSVTNLELAEQ